MKTAITSLFFLLVSGTTLLCHAGTALPRRTPESQAVSSRALLDLVRTLDQQIEGMHSLMILRHGQVIVEGWWKPYATEHNHVLYSLSKSFTSTAVGLAVEEGKLSVDDEVLPFFPDAAPAKPSNNLKAMRVRDLLTMTTGHQEEPPTSPPAMSPESFLAHPVPHLPGTHFKYNTAATFLQSAIVQKVTGTTVLEYLRPRLFEPLGIDHPAWETNFQGISLGGYGLRIRTEDIAKFGQLYLQKGKWNGRQLVPAKWVALATSRQVSNGSNPQSDWNQGYGFQFWRSRNNGYRGDGAFGQYCVVLPDLDVVVAITSGVRDMPAILNRLWEKLLPACGTKKLRDSASAQEELRAVMAGLEVRPAQGAAASSKASSFVNRIFKFPANDQKLESATLKMAQDSKSLTLELRQNGTTSLYPAGFQQWVQGRAPLHSGILGVFPEERIAGTFAWAGEDTCLLKVCFYETPYHLIWTLKFSGNEVLIDSEANVAFGPVKRGQLLGKTE